MTETAFTPGSLVRARGREWVVLPAEDPEILLLRPLVGTQDETAGILIGAESVESAQFSPPTINDLGDARRARLLHSAMRIGFRSGAGPFRSMGSLSVEPRPYQLVPLLMALRIDPVRLLIADDVGVGKTIEAGLIAAELLAQGDAHRLAVLCSPQLAEQWEAELRQKFGIHATPVLSSTVARLERDCPFGMNLFEYYRHVIVSTDLIKKPDKRLDFVRQCPDLVIVDEAHTCVAADGSAGMAHQRYKLVQELAATPSRHVLLVTATPHSGKEDAFRSLIGLLSPQLATLPDQLSENDRRLLARHLVQRRREDIRAYVETTPFPRREEPVDAHYTLSPAYKALFDRALRLARETVRDEEGRTLQGRIRWWSALALLQSMASSPAAAATTLKTRAANADAATPEEADDIGRAIVLDLQAEADTEARDTVAGASDDDEHTSPLARRLRELARDIEKLPADSDRKLTLATEQIKQLLDKGFNPIVFCRFIPTANYVAAHLAKTLATRTAVEAVTGTLPPDIREERIRQLADEPTERRVLVATDCLSEGINLQQYFNAVVHYDLAWNPTRHEQREGRVDRFGQLSPSVRVVTVRGTDNRVDPLVLNVLLRKHERIRTSTGVSVPVPGDAGLVLGAIAEQLLLVEQDPEQLALDLELDTRTTALHQRWDEAAHREQAATRSRFAQHTIDHTEVAREVAAIHAALGEPDEVAEFVRSALVALGAAATPTPEGFTATTAELPSSLRDVLPPRTRDELVFWREAPTPPSVAALLRTDPTVEAIARHVLDTALDSSTTDHRTPARRCGVMRTTKVDRRSVLLVLRYRFHLNVPTTDGSRPLIAEDADIAAYRTGADGIQWLPDDDARRLLDALPNANVATDQARHTLERALTSLDTVMGDITSRAHSRGDDLAAAHRRIRQAARARLRGLDVRVQTPVDVLGVYVFLPTPAGESR